MLVRQCESMFLRICAHECKYDYTSKCVRVHVQLCVFFCLRICVSMCVYLCAVVCVCVQKFGWVYTLVYVQSRDIFCTVVRAFVHKARH